ncbi:hypothetical protein F5H01DRAFT_367428 [Linnemannia elongata]|nr:hypothetical protein F5H01DRAFT_367428 [Linnemannia elongata]
MLGPDCTGLDTAIHNGSSRRLLSMCPRDVEMSKEDRRRWQDMPSDNYIRQHRLDSSKYLGHYIKPLKTGCFEFYPYIVDFCECDCNNRNGPWSDSDDGGCPYGDGYVILVGFKISDTQEFLEAYAKKVSENYQNDIAYLI